MDVDQMESALMTDKMLVGSLVAGVIGSTSFGDAFDSATNVAGLERLYSQSLIYDGIHFEGCVRSTATTLRHTISFFT